MKKVHILIAPLILVITLVICSPVAAQRGGYHPPPMKAKTKPVLRRVSAKGKELRRKERLDQEPKQLENEGAANLLHREDEANTPGNRLRKETPLGSGAAERFGCCYLDRQGGML